MHLKTNEKQIAMKGITKIHNARFYDPSPRGINCLDYNKISHKLALARNDGSLEIWDMRHAPYLEKVKYRDALENTIESIVWANKRLFTAGFNGEVIEWNTKTMQPKAQQRVTGNVIWCLAVNKTCTELAIGTEEGYINIFDIENDEFQYKLLFDKQEGRVLCCSYDATGNFLVTGSLEVLRIWNARTGHAVNKMTFPKTVDGKETIIWTLCVLKDFSIIAGDSRGFITVYDGHTGAHLESHQVLKADLLALNVNEAEDMLVCSGVEPIIRIYAKTKIKREDTVYYRWVKYLQRAVHDHNVKALVCTPEDRIISGGVDGFLGVSSLTRMRSTISKYGQFLRQPCVSVASEANLVLLRYAESLEIWLLGAASNDAKEHPKKADDAKQLPLDTSPVKLLEFRSKDSEPIVCATISQDGKWLCYATQHETRLFQISTHTDAKGKHGLQLTRCCKNSNFDSLPATALAFSRNGEALSLFLLSNSRKQLRCFALIDLDIFDEKAKIDLSKQLKGTITHFKVSEDGKVFVLADDQHTIAVYADFEHRLNLPRYEAAATTALALHARSRETRVVVAYADSRIVEYDVEKAAFTCYFDHSNMVPNTETHCVTDILLDARNPNVFVLQNDGFLYTLAKCASGHQESKDVAVTPKKSKRGAASDAAANTTREMTSLDLVFQKPFEHLLQTCWISGNDLLTINVNASALIEKLPPVFRQKKYGKM